MGVKVEFSSGKTATYKNATGFKQNSDEFFKGKSGKGYRAPAYVIFFGKGKKPIHFRKSMVRSIYQV
ncbi:MAG: hypothetical protein P8Y97_21275 [Candidatus Lokiarchaeota archaeon]